MFLQEKAWEVGAYSVFVQIQNGGARKGNLQPSQRVSKRNDTLRKNRNNLSLPSNYLHLKKRSCILNKEYRH